MKTFPINQIQQAQEWRPQLERFITSTTIYVVETPADYASLDPSVQSMISLLKQIG